MEGTTSGKSLRENTGFTFNMGEMLFALLKYIVDPKDAVSSLGLRLTPKTWSGLTDLAQTVQAARAGASISVVLCQV